jgi:hypothetical protein
MMEVMSAAASGSMLEQYPVLAKAPLYIRASLIFPYNQGLRFQHAMVQQLGNDAFRKVFRDAPVSTQQILHPELYLKGTQPVRSALPALAQPRQWKMLTESTAGEFDHAVLLEQYLSRKDADELAPHWRGGSFALAERKAGGLVAMLYSSEWADEASARRMFEAYRTVLQRKSEKLEWTSQAATELIGTGDYGLFRVTREGTRVTAAEGLATIEDLARQVN